MRTPETLMMKRIREISASRPAVLDRKSAEGSRVRAYRRYVEDEIRLSQLGYVSERGVSMRLGSRPLTPEEVREVEAITGGY